MSEISRPSLTINVPIGSENQELKWTYAIQRDILGVVPVGNIEQLIPSLMVDTHTQDFVLRRVLTRDKVVKIDNDLFDIDSIDMSPDSAEMIMNWVTDHVLYFFVMSARSAKNVADKYQETIQQLNPSSDGSQT